MGRADGGDSDNVVNSELSVEQAMLLTMQSEHLRSAGSLFRWGSGRLVAILSWSNPQLVQCSLVVRLDGPKIDDIRLNAYCELDEDTILMKNSRVAESFHPTGGDLEEVLQSLAAEAHAWSVQDVEQDVAMTHLPTKIF